MELKEISQTNFNELIEIIGEKSIELSKKSKILLVNRDSTTLRL